MVPSGPGFPAVMACLLCASFPGTAAQTLKDRRNAYTPNTDTRFTPPVYRSAAEWRARSAELKAQILTAAGLNPMPARPPVRAVAYRTISREEVEIETLLVETMPGYYVGANVYRPKGKRGRLPTVAHPHGHWPNGRIEDSRDMSTPALAGNLARLGMLVIAWDMAGYNDAVQTPHAFAWADKGHAASRELLWSFTPLGLQLWNSLRIIDYLETRPDVDMSRLAMTGASGGATQTFLAAAVDPRIQAAVPANMISTIMQGGSPCENAPGLRVGTSNLEIAALIAPRPLLMISASGDWTRNTPKVEFPAMQTFYVLFRRPDNLELAHFDAPHNYNQASREAAYRFLAKRFLPSADPRAIHEQPVRAESAQDLLVLKKNTLPPGALTYEQVFARWRDMASAAAPSRQRLVDAMMLEWPGRVDAERQEQSLILSRPGRGDRVKVIAVAGTDRKQPPLLVVHPEGAEAARALVPSGREALLVTVFQTGASVESRDSSHKFFLAFNRSDDANRVQDILTALAWFRRSGVTLKCTGKAAVWCTFAAAAAPVPVVLDAPLNGFSGSDEDFLRDFFVPGIQRAGGLDAARAILRETGIETSTGQPAPPR